MPQEQFVDLPHQRQILVVVRRALPIDPRARQTQHGALAAHRQRRIAAIEHRSAVRRAHRPDLLAKKSFSIVNRPILACSFSIS